MVAAGCILVIYWARRRCWGCLLTARFGLCSTRLNCPISTYASRPFRLLVLPVALHPWSISCCKAALVSTAAGEQPRFVICGSLTPSRTLSWPTYILTALERTFLAYLRTSVMMATLGVLIAQLFTIQSSDPGFGYHALGQPMATVCLSSSIIILLLGCLRFWRWQAALVRGKSLCGGPEIVIVAVGLLLVRVSYWAIQPAASPPRMFLVSWPLFHSEADSIPLDCLHLLGLPDSCRYYQGSMCPRHADMRLRWLFNAIAPYGLCIWYTQLTGQSCFHCAEAVHYGGRPGYPMINHAMVIIAFPPLEASQGPWSGHSRRLRQVCWESHSDNHCLPAFKIIHVVLGLLNNPQTWD